MSKFAHKEITDIVSTCTGVPAWRIKPTMEITRHFILGVQLALSLSGYEMPNERGRITVGDIFTQNRGHQKGSLL